MYGEVVNQPPEGVPPQLWRSLVEELDPQIAPFLPYLHKNLTLTYEDLQGRLGLTRFGKRPERVECRRRFKMGPGAITILLHPDLNGDVALEGPHPRP